MASTLYKLTADIGAEFNLDIRHKDSDGVLFDYSTGFTMRFVMMTAVGGTDIFDETSPNADFVLSDGAGDTANISISIGKTLTSLWLAQNAVYELLIWPDAATDEVNIPIKGEFIIRAGLL